MLSSLKEMIYFGLKKAKGSYLQDNIRWLQKHQFQPYEVLYRERERLLLKLLEEAYTWVPAYRERITESGVHYQGRYVLSNFHELPLLTRDDLVYQGPRFTHEKAHERGIYYFKTGGSTATPVEIGQDSYYRDWALAEHMFFSSWSGLTIGKPYFLLWAAYRDLHNQLNSWKDKLLIGNLQGRRILNCRVTSPETFTSFIETINEQTDCEYMIGYAYELYALACHSIEHNMPITNRLKGIYATAENLTDRMRETIESVFKCHVFNRYGCRDAGEMACECEYHHGLHINPLYSFVEVVDENGYPLPYGEPGQILVTSLHNYAMPLIRYRLGDEGIMKAPERCSCGREWESFTQILGRTSEKIFVQPDSWFGGAFLHTAFDHLPYVKRYQIHQHSTNHLVVKIRSAIPDYTIKYEAELQEVTRRIEKWSGMTFSIQYQQTEEFEKTPTGKELLVINKMITPEKPAAV